MDSITGTVDQIIFHKTSDYSLSGNKYLISKFTHEKEGKSVQSVVKGEMNSPVYGWQYKLYGSWADTDRGQAFLFDSFEPIIPRSYEGMADYISKSIPAIGKVRARLIVDHFGNESFSILKTDPSRLKEVPGIPAIAREQAEAFFSSDNALEIDPAAYAAIHDLLSPIRPPRRVIKSLLENFGSNAPQFVTNNPYKLLDYPGMGWLRVDRFAVEVLKYDPKGIERHKKSIIEVLSREGERGHTKTDIPTLRMEASSLLKTVLNSNAIDYLIEEGIIILEDEYISSYKLYNAERSIVQEIRRLQNSNTFKEFDISEDEFDDKQKQIPFLVKNNPVSIITGVPGSGKSRSVSIIVKILYGNGIHNIIIVAPTGKAAKRNDEFIQQLLPGISIPCMTIHRALGGQLSAQAEEGIPEEEARVNRGRDQFQFQHRRDNPLPYEFFIMDESSMCDASLASALLEAIPDDSRLLIVGDHYQLPSVGPGSFLRDLMSAGIPSVVLDKPRRNSGSIAQACYQIKEGHCPNPQYLANNSDSPSNLTYREVNDDNKILDTIRDIHINYINKYGIDRAKSDLQVISPEKKGILGCHNLSRLLGSVMNPEEGPLPPSKGKEDLEAAVRNYDKIVRTKNGWVDMLTKEEPNIDEEDLKTIIFEGQEYYISECYVVNGDSGNVCGFKGSDIFVQFSNPDRLCKLPKSDAHVSLAYAMTVHKCQGSGFPIVILPLTNYYWNTMDNVGLSCRELWYTAFSRAIDRLIIIGRIGELKRAISRVTIHQRKTRLAELFQNENIQIL